MRAISTKERRARLAARHHLARPATDLEVVAGDLVGLHSSDPTTVYLAARARVGGLAHADVDDALYERRSLLRMVGMRRTLFVVPIELAGSVDAACTKSLVAGERTRLIRMLEGQGVARDGADWLDDVASRTLAAIDARGEASAAELTKDVPELGRKLRFGEGRSWATEVGVSTRVLFLLATEARIVRARPLGTWVSGQYRWARTSHWLGRGLPVMRPEVAAAQVLSGWLRTFGPGTMTDLRWWTGWPQRDVKATLAAVGAVEVALEEGTGYVLPDDVDPPPRSRRRWVALLPGLDPTTMGWKERDWYLGTHAADLFDRNGNAGPTVWADGHVVGGWGQRADGAVAVRLLEEVEPTTRRAIDAEVRRLTTWLDGVRVSPRFPTPIDRAIATEAP